MSYDIELHLTATGPIQASANMLGQTLQLSTSAKTDVHNVQSGRHSFLIRAIGPPGTKLTISVVSEGASSARSLAIDDSGAALGSFVLEVPAEGEDWPGPRFTQTVR